MSRVLSALARLRLLAWLLALAPSAGCHRVQPAEQEAVTVSPATRVEAWRASQGDVAAAAAAVDGGAVLGATDASTPPTDAPPATLVLPSDQADSDAGSDDLRAPVQLPHPAGNDLTYPCHVDSDCKFGACFVPGPGPDANPICSKRCESDAECPTGALCTQPMECEANARACGQPGYCFRACVSDDECTALNAIDTERDTDLPGNPVACVSWAPILDSLDPGRGQAPIEVCIQASEP